MTPQKRAEFLQLFRQFAAKWLNQKEGEQRVRRMKESAAVGRANFLRLVAESQRGNDVGITPLQLLLPHADSKSTRSGEVWISHTPAIRGSIEKYVSPQWIHQAELPHTASALLHFLQTCNDHPDQLAETCQWFASLPYTKGLQSGMLTPMLSVLRPEPFLLFNNHSRGVLNHFAETHFGHSIVDYPSANAAGLGLIAEVAAEMLELADRYDLHLTQLFDHFSHYLAIVGMAAQPPPQRATKGESAPPLNRNSPQAAAEVLATLYPEPEVRRACEEYLAETIQFASTLHNNNWALTLHPREIRLSVGPVEVLRLSKNEVLLLLDAASLAPRDRRKISPPVEFSRRRYRSIPGEKGIGEMGVKEFMKLRERFREAHQEFIRKASAKATATAWGASYSTGVVQHLRQLTNAEILDPEYFAQATTHLPPMKPDDKPVDRPQHIVGDVATEYNAEKGTQIEGERLQELARETGHPIELLRGWIEAIQRKGQAIIYGPPGTGKTFLAERLALYLSAGGEGMQELVQFHPSYSYEDFVIGIRPVSREGVVEYPMQPGRFVEFCRKAQARRGTCVLVIDEINRADISRAFGELMYLLEYRDRTIELAGGWPFRIPANVRIIGTMNTADRSIALLDYALRRRFAFIELRPDYGLLRRYHAGHNRSVEGLVSTLERINSRINNPQYELGISFFLHPNLPALLPAIWEMEIEPYLAEYFYDQADVVDEFRWKRMKEEWRMED